MHQNNRKCVSCSEKLALVNLDLVEWFSWIWERVKGVHISWGFRNEKDQNRFYKEGKSTLPYPLSKHNFISKTGKPESLALDLFKLDDDGKAVFSKEWYTEIARLSKEQTIPIRWGGDFNKFKDYCHFELDKRED